MLQIELAARPENIARAREAVVARAGRLGMADSRLSALRTVASEAFTNAVLYAYAEDEEGPVELALATDGEELRLTVRDSGAGIFPRPERDVPSLNMGLPIIGALSSRFQLTSVCGGGTELEIRMPLGAAA